jgi:hypothetical protein
MKAAALRATGVFGLAAALGSVFAIYRVDFGIPGGGLWGLLGFAVVCGVLADATGRKGR